LSTSSQHTKSISDTEAFKALVAAIDRNVSPDRAAELLADFRNAVRSETFASAANFLAEIGTPIHGERTQHDVGVMYASERLRAFGSGGAR
jgi:hypothetical protein